MLVDAKEARVITERSLRKLMTEEMESVERQITKAMNGGFYSVELEQYQLYEETITYLESRGYKVSRPIGDNVEVSWKC